MYLKPVFEKYQVWKELKNILVGIQLVSPIYNSRDLLQIK